MTVACTINTFPGGGTVVGLMGTGLKLQNQGGGDLVIAGNGTFAFATPQASGTPFAVTIATQPTAPDQTCTLSGATGTVGAAAVTSVTVNCDTNQHVVGGTVAHLAGTGLSLALNGGTPQAVSGNRSVRLLDHVAERRDLRGHDRQSAGDAHADVRHHGRHGGPSPARTSRRSP